jgi:hypothetical protein
MRNLISINKKCELSQKEEKKEMQLKREEESKQADENVNKRKIIEKVSDCLKTKRE